MASPEQKKGQFAQKVEQSLGIIPGTKLYSPFPFAGMNLQDTPVAIDDHEFTFIENFFRLGNGYLRTAWDVGDRFFSAGDTLHIVYFFWYNIGVLDYVAVFFDDGTAVQIQQSNRVVIPISAVPGTFFTPGGSVPVCSQSGTQYLIIANNQHENDYWIWDGHLLFTAGSLAPGLLTVVYNGSNYTSLPTLTTYGGSGSGATYDVTLQSGGVLEVEVTNPGSGYQVGDIPQIAFSGGGSDDSAILQANLNSGSVTAVTVTNPGSGYTTATVAFSGGGGSGAAATATIGTGLDTLTITAPGSGYTAATVFFSGGGGTGAAASAVVIGGQVTELDITDPGQNYTSAPTVAITGDGTGATATATVQNGVITTIQITASGGGYTTAPTVTITGDGAGATASAIISSSGVPGVTVVNPGSGFITAPTISCIGGGGQGAQGTVLLVGTSIARIDLTSPGSGYTQSPVISLLGGGGTGFVGHGVLGNGGIISVDVWNGGSGYTKQPEVLITAVAHDTGIGGTGVAIFKPTVIDKVVMGAFGTGYTTAPAVVVTPGSNNAAAVAPLSTMPFGISGNALETYNQRVWVFHPFQKFKFPTGGDFIVSASESLTDFATSDGGVLFVNSDRFLRKEYIGARQSNGYLYCFGDSSVSVVSNIQTTGNPATTTFSYQNVDPQVGMAWRDSVQDFGRTTVFANKTGIYALYGGAAAKISGKLDILFDNAIFPPDARAITPVSAISTIHNVKHYFLLFTIRDPETFAVRNVMATWNEQQWTLTSQTVTLTFIGTQEVDSQNIAWGTDGTNIYQLFAQPSSTLLKRFSTKMYGGDALFILKDFLNIYLQAQDLSPGVVGIDIDVNLVSSGIAKQDSLNESVASEQFNSANYPAMLFQPPKFNATPPFFPVWGTGTGGFSFDTLMAEFSTLSPDFALANLVLAYLDNTAYQ